MNDNEPEIDDDLPPEWVWDIFDRHDLGGRTDSIDGAANVLPDDATD